MNDLRNCDEIFRKDMACDNIKVKETGFHSLFRKYIFGKTAGIRKSS